MMPIQRPLITADFVQGTMQYSDHYPGDPENIRIVIPIIISGGNEDITVRAIVDTGGYCILNPRYANEINSPRLGLDLTQIWVRGVKYSGYMHLIPIKLYPFDGIGVEVEANVFVPKLRDNEEWNLPNFLGYKGFLEKIRFAVDPDNSQFYFGALGE